MKTETKSKIKKAIKVGAYVGGLLLALVLGMGFGSCSEKKMQDQSSQNAEPKKMKPRLAVADGFNLLDFADSSPAYYCVRYNGSNECAPSSASRVYYLNKSVMPAGHTYVITFNGDALYYNTPNYTGFMGVCSNPLLNAIQRRAYYSDFSSDDVKWVIPSPSDLSSPVIFTLPADAYGGSGTATFANFFFTSLNSVSGIYIADEGEWLSIIPSIKEISFSKTSWFPYQLLGQNNSPVIAGPYNGGTMDTKEKGITDVLFSSNGRLFKGILFSFAPLAQVGSTASQQRNPSTYGYYNQDMTPIGTPQECHSDYLWYLAQVDYIPVDGGPFVYVGGQRMKQFSDFSQSVTQFFDWVDNRYADISVKWAGSALNTEITTTSGLTNLQWLENIASSVFDNTISLGGGSVDVFSLIGNGFSSITSILSIQILPYLTLGTLLLAPLVILLALAILKVLNK